MKRIISIACIAVLCSAALSPANNGAALITRRPFRVPLAKIQVSFNRESNRYDQVRIMFDDSGEFFVIAPSDDSHTRRNGETTVYRELPQTAHHLSNFEASTISRVCRTFILALEEYETILKNEDWGRAAFLDSYFALFLRGFHVMMCAARNGPDGFPDRARVLDEDFDVSENSPKTDARIRMWRAEKDRIMILRIASKELVKQIKEWQKSELNDTRRNPEIDYSRNFEQAYLAFVRNYFGYVPVR